MSLLGKDNITVLKGIKTKVIIKCVPFSASLLTKSKKIQAENLAEFFQTKSSRNFSKWNLFC
jgi:hypothetical protein